MMLTLNDGRTELWQWDTGRTLAVDADCSQVHFSNKVFGRSIDVDVIDGAAVIPDILLQTDKDLNVWAFVGTAENGYTKISKTFKVNRRNKPSDYVFTPVEQTTIAEIAAIAQSVRDDADAGLFKGDTGATGPKGETGPQGPKGDTGAAGEDGKSAYQYAVEGGYTGTEAEFSARMAAEIPTVDSTLAQSGQAADAAEVGARLSSLSEDKVSLPKAEDGTIIPGTAGWYAVSDGAGGIKWVESAPSTGGGDAGTATETEIDVSFFDVGSFTGATGVIKFTTNAEGAPTQYGAMRMSNYELIDCTDGANLSMRLAAADDFLSAGVQCRCFLYNDTEGALAGSVDPNGDVYTADRWGSPNLIGDTDYTFKTAGYYVRFVLGRNNSFSSNANWGTYLNTKGNVTVSKVAASSDNSTETASTEEATLMMASYSRVYVDTGVYTEYLKPKWDGMFSIHRGYSTAPDNTLQAIWEAKKHGYNCCELDVRYTSDNQVVLNHDATVTGTVDGVEVTYTIADTPLATLQTVCIGNTAFPDAKVCSLEDAMRLCRRIGMRPEIDYKVSNEQLYKDCVALSMKYGLQDDTLHCCYGMSYALTVKTEYEKANLRVDGALLDSDTSLDAYIPKPGNLYAFYSAAACGKTDGSNVGANVDNETRILAHKAKGYKMYVWNVTPNLLPDVMQWEPDILQPQSAKDTSDWYTLIRELNSFDGLIW